MIVFTMIGIAMITLWCGVIDSVDMKDIPREKTTTMSITSELKSYQVTKYYRTRTTEEIVYED